MSEFQYITEIVLPSHKGNLYPDHPELKEPIKLRMIRVDDEAEYLGNHSEETINNLIRACVVEPKDFDPTILLDEDRYVLLMKLRIHSYGEEFHIETRCPACGHEDFDKKISLDEIPIIELDEEFSEPIEVVLPTMKKTLGVRWLRANELKKISTDARMKARAQKKKPSIIEYYDRVVKCIVTIDGEEAKLPDIKKLVKAMPGRDRAMIDHTLNKYRFGSTSRVEIECQECGHTYEAPVSLSGEFFRPRYDDES